MLPGIFLLLSSFTDCRNRSLPVLYVCLATFFVSGTIPGFFTSLVCIAPQFTGMVNSVARFSGQLSAVITPLAIGNIVKQVLFLSRKIMQNSAKLYQRQLRVKNDFMLIQEVKYQRWIQLAL